MNWKTELLTAMDPARMYRVVQLCAGYEASVVVGKERTVLGYGDQPGCQVMCEQHAEAARAEAEPAGDCPKQPSPRPAPQAEDDHLDDLEAEEEVVYQPPLLSWQISRGRRQADAKGGMYESCYRPELFRWEATWDDHTGRTVLARGDAPECKLACEEHFRSEQDGQPSDPPRPEGPESPPPAEVTRSLEDEPWFQSLRQASEEIRRLKAKIRTLEDEANRPESSILTDRQLCSIFPNAASTTLPCQSLQGDGLSVIDALCAAGLAPNKSEARRIISQGAGYVNNRQIAHGATRLGLWDQTSESMMILWAGNKYALLRFEECGERDLGAIVMEDCRKIAAELDQPEAKPQGDTVKSKKGTGRTTRMIEEAIRLARTGRTVCIVTATEQHARTLEQQVHELDDETQPVKLCIRCEAASELGDDFDWKTLSRRGARSVFLADHYTIECEFRAMLEMLTRFDQPEKE